MVYSTRRFVSSPEHEVHKVAIVIGQCPSSVVRRASSVDRRAASIIALKAFSSYTPGPTDSKLGRKYRGDL